MVILSLIRNTMDSITKLLNDLSPAKTVGIGVITGLLLFVAESCISCFAKRMHRSADHKPEETIQRENPETEYGNQSESRIRRTEKPKAD